MSAAVFDAFALPPGFVAGDYEQIEREPGGSDSAPAGPPHVHYRVPSLSGAEVGVLAAHLREAGRALSTMGQASVAAALGRVGARFRDAGDGFRCEALDLLPATAGLSPEMAEVVLDGMAADWTAERLSAVIEAEFGPYARAGQFVDESRSTGDPSAVLGRVAAVVPPRLCAQIVSGSVPGVGVNAMVRALLVGGPTLVKPGFGDVVLPVLFARALQEEDPTLAAAVAVVYWPGGSVQTEDALMSAADVVVVYGSDETVRSVRTRAPATSRVVAYHDRLSVAIVGRDAFSDAQHDARAVASELAEAVAMFDQRGCVCPQIVFVEEGGLSPEDFAGLLAEALSEVEDRLPSAPLDVDEASALQQWRGSAEMWEATGSGRMHHGGAHASWTVVYEPEPHPGVSPGGRSIRVRPLRDVAAIDEQLEPFGPYLQTVGYAGLAGRVEALATRLGLIGASRVVPLRAMAFPRPWWLHDGRGPLRDLVRWVELERD